MGFRFKRSVKIAPGIRFNVSKSGVSTTIGGRGASVNIGKRGTYANVGIPGTGISYRSKISGSSPSTSPRNSSRILDDYDLLSTELKLLEDGKVAIYDDIGEQLPPRYVKLAREQEQRTFDDWLRKEADKINKDIDSILKIHVKTPSPDIETEYKRKPFPAAKPTFKSLAEPELKEYGILAKLFGPLRNKIDSENALILEDHKRKVDKAKSEYSKAVDNWQRNKDAFDKKQAYHEHVMTKGRYESTDIMAELFERKIADISWPRETLVDFDIVNNGKKVLVDVDLPEIEDMPARIATIAKNKLKLNIKNKSQTQIRKDYMAHVHGIGFLVTGVIFATLPLVDEVIISTYSQRLNSATGHISDEYLYSAIVAREQWTEINFRSLDQVDIVETFSIFELKRNMTKTGIFKPIEPF